MLTKKRFKVFGIVTLLVLLLMACSDGKEDSSENKNNDGDAKKKEPIEEYTIDEPITLRMINWWPEETWVKQWKEPVEKKFPNVTLEQIVMQPEPDQLDDLYASKQTPDLFIGHAKHVTNLLEYETALDMSDLIATHGLDTDELIPGLMDQVEQIGANEEVYYLPFLVDRYVLHYNKDIFDQFGVPYPTDDMTYEEVFELAKKVTGEQNGVNYYGLQWQADSFDSVGKHLTALEAKTAEPTFTTNNQWGEFYSFIEKVYDIPGNLPEQDVFQSYVWERFIGEGNVAMVPLWYNPGLMDTEVNWDMVSYPSWPEFEGQVPGGVGFGIGVTSVSEHQDAAFKVLQYLLSEEAVTERYYNDGLSISHLIYDPSKLDIEWDAAFDKVNFEALFNKEFISLERHPLEGNIFSEAVIQEMPEFLYSNTDVNTHLRNLNEKATILLKDLEAQQ